MKIPRGVKTERADVSSDDDDGDGGRDEGGSDGGRGQVVVAVAVVEVM